MNGGKRSARRGWSHAALLILIPAVSAAQTFQAPEIVFADETGSFEYQATFTAGPGGDVLASYIIDGTANTNLGVFTGDFFCFVGIEEGETWPVFVGGSLLDPAVEGSVFIEFSTGCPGGSGQSLVVETVVVPPPPISVDIDIKPDSDANAINPFARGAIAVAVLGSASFDVADVDAITLAFGPDAAPPKHDLSDPVELAHHLRDVNGDGRTDLISHHSTRDTGIVRGQTHACLSGRTWSGMPFHGCDAIATETPSGGAGCGLGFELTLIVPLLARRRRRRAAHVGASSGRVV
ncbi:MAG: hypothetical protein JSU66_10620 [Deltaproteobacteria bacterium]|nr:MAG: hypothetical protein JSU66_10620 [Deltaproteobacteria bacterium]